MLFFFFWADLRHQKNHCGALYDNYDRLNVCSVTLENFLVRFSHLFWPDFLFVVVPRSNISVSSRQLRQSSRELRGQMILPEDFDWKAYTAYNPDVFNMGVTSEEAAVEYYLDKGAEQGLVHHRLNVLLRYTACTGKLIISRLNKLGQIVFVLIRFNFLITSCSLAPFQATCNTTLSLPQVQHGIDTECAVHLWITLPQPDQD